MDITYSPAEERFDRITRLAQRIFEVPIALISLVTHESQWFKSCQGLTISETSREVSFCAHALHSDDALIIPDVEENEDFCDNPLVTSDPAIKFYAGQPIKFSGHRLGTLCIIDKKPRQLTIADLDSLKTLAGCIETELLMWRNSHNKFLQEILQKSDRKQLIDEVTGDINDHGLTLVQSSLSTEGASNKAIQISITISNMGNKNFDLESVNLIRKELAQSVRAELNDRGILGAMGIDGFVVILPEESEVKAEEFVENLTNKISCCCIPLPFGEFRPELGFSILS